MPNRAPDFRYVYTNALGLVWSDNDCRIMFGIEENNGPEDMYEQVGIAMGHKTAKVLANHLRIIIEHYEADKGIEIPIDEEKVSSLVELLNNAKKDASAS